jgi:Ca-activated chloride channel homolog
MVARPVLLALVLAFAAALGSAAVAQTYVQLILDASGSMFNRLEDGRYRIVAAKEVLTDVVGGLAKDADLNVGLRVYGSRLGARDPLACEDSHLLVPMAGVDRDALLETVRGVQANGATPIAYSLERAGEDFPATGRHVIVLVTDGEESCGGDPRAVMDALRARGLEVDLRIIGIDLSERAVASFSGLGTFENTRSGPELAAALSRAVATVADTVEETFEVTAVVLRGGVQAVDGVVVTFVGAVSDRPFAFAETERGRHAALLPAGAYRAEVEDAFSDRPLEVGGLTVTPEGERVFTFELASEVEVALTVTPLDPLAGGTVAVTYAGAPGGERNWITVVPVDAPEGDAMAWGVADGSEGEVAVRVPDGVLTLEARFHLALPEGGTRVIGRSEPFTSREAVATLRGPAEVGAGAVFEVAWTGPDQVDDYVTIVPAGADDGTYLSYAYTGRGNPALLTAPLEPGEYELRYTSDSRRGRPLATAPITVTAQAYAVRPPAEVAAGAAFDVVWEGPGNSRDYVTIVREGAPLGSYLSYAYTRAGNPARLQAPLEPGRYEVRYSSEAQSPNPTLASASLVVTAESYAVSGPAEVAAGAAIEVTWRGPGNTRDYVTIVPRGAPEGAYLDYAYTRNGNPLRITAPVEPGDYELRYSSEAASPNPILASSPIRVTAAAITLDAPERVAPGASFEVAWTGPDGPSDYITIVPAGSGDGAYLSYAYTSSGSPVTLTAPTEAGAYEIWYASDRVRGTFARRPITVR